MEIQINVLAKHSLNDCERMYSFVISFVHFHED